MALLSLEIRLCPLVSQLDLVCHVGIGLKDEVTLGLNRVCKLAKVALRISQLSIDAVADGPPHDI